MQKNGVTTPGERTGGWYRVRPCNERKKRKTWWLAMNGDFGKDIRRKRVGGLCEVSKFLKRGGGIDKHRVWSRLFGRGRKI